MASHAALETVDYILSKQVVADLDVNQRDHYNEDDQWGVFYYEDEEMSGMRGDLHGDRPTWLRWAVVKGDRNRMASRWIKAKKRQDLDGLVTVKFEGKGDELDEQSLQEYKRAKACCRSLEPDRSPLHYAMEEGNLRFAERLLSKGANLNQKDWFGMTPVHTAAKHGDRELVQLLCTVYRADLTLVDNTGSTASVVAIDNAR